MANSSERSAVEVATQPAGEVAADERLVRALKHPLRLELLRRFVERTATPNELAHELGEPIGNVAYHVRDLVAIGYLELVRTEPRRGAVAHYYRATIRPSIPDAEWARLDPKVRAQMSSRVLQNMFGEAVAALRSGTMDSQLDRHLSWRSLALDEQGWADLTVTMAATMERIAEIEAESTTRRVDSGEPSMSAIAALMSFERSP
jgi:DNA-binding transcriptional ArsR family regulator